MKQLELSNTSFRYLEQSFKEWLDIMGYAPVSVYYMPVHVRELLHHLEGKGMKNIKELESKGIQQYYNKLKERSNQRRGGGLSNNHLNKHIQALRKFTDYLRQVGRLDIPVLNLHNETSDPKSIAVLSEEEIQMLFDVTHKMSTVEDRPHYNLSTAQIEAIQSRDRAGFATFDWTLG